MRVGRPARRAVVVVALALVLAGCSAPGDPGPAGGPAGGSATPVAGGAPPSTAPAEASAAPTPTDRSPAGTPPADDAGAAAPRPGWLGTRVLPVDPATGFGTVLPTPPELVDRRLDTPDHLPPPTAPGFEAVVGSVPDDVLARSTWDPACPVAVEDLRWVRLPFVGFDGDRHTGELLVHADAVAAVVAGFRTLHDRAFPIEEMRITRPEELDAPPTGDGNNTSAFVCRPSVGTTTWSEHALGRAVDVNPFHNPYVKGQVVLPELASSYVDRTDLRSGMLTAEDVAGFTAAGWGWGGTWRSSSDPMHVSASGR